MCNPIHIIADDRERNSGVIQAFQVMHEVDLDIKRLPVGDYLVDGSFIFERKTLDDFCLSIIQGRLFSQACNLSKYDGRPVMILEGTSRDLYCARLKS